jgi:hypothetical protein
VGVDGTNYAEHFHATTSSSWVPSPARFPFVAEQGISAGLPLQVDARPKQKRTVRAPADGAGGDVEGLLS